MALFSVFSGVTVSDGSVAPANWDVKADESSFF